MAESARFSAAPGEESDDSPFDLSSPFRIIVCMLPEGSRRLRTAKYVQSDISFKRIIGFKEFVLGGLDSETRTCKLCFLFFNFLPLG